jgi:hypothetical protein
MANSQAARARRCKQLLRWHRQHVGLYARVATKLKVSPSYVSLVAREIRQSTQVMAALSEGLEHLLRVAPKLND